MEAKTDITGKQVQEIIDKCDVCYLGMSSPEGYPYVLPFNFGYHEGALYLHSGQGGRKFDLLQNNNRACAAFSTDHELQARHDHVACSYFFRYRSVLLHGYIEMIEQYEEKIRALNIIMKKYAGRGDFKYNAPAINNVRTFRLIVEKAEGRTFGY